MDQSNLSISESLTGHDSLAAPKSYSSFNQTNHSSDILRRPKIIVLIQSGAPLASYPVYTFAWSPDGRLLATSDADEAAVELWDTTTWQLVRRLEGLALLGFGRNRNILAERPFAGHSWWQGVVRLWGVADGTLEIRD